MILAYLRQFWAVSASIWRSSPKTAQGKRDILAWFFVHDKTNGDLHEKEQQGTSRKTVEGTALGNHRRQVKDHVGRVAGVTHVLLRPDTMRSTCTPILPRPKNHRSRYLSSRCSLRGEALSGPAAARTLNPHLLLASLKKHI